MLQQHKISVTVITGFLGAGKTTFINFLLNKYFDRQFALVENEFGEVSIDTKLIKGVDASQMFELKKGCICCTISEEYELVLQELAELFPHVEHLIIETTGIADPTSIIQPFYRDENLQKKYHFSGTVCLVDALNFEFIPKKEIAWKQLAVADFILITKTEKLTENRKNELREKVIQINPLCKTGFSFFGEIPEFNFNSIQTKNRYFPVGMKSHSNIETKTLKFESPLNRINFTNWLSYFLDINKNNIYRIKGILCFENEPFEFILQGVGGSFEITEGDLIVGDKNSTIVFIGILEGLILS